MQDWDIGFKVTSLILCLASTLTITIIFLGKGPLKFFASSIETFPGIESFSTWLEKFSAEICHQRQTWIIWSLCIDIEHCPLSTDRRRCKKSLEKESENNHKDLFLFVSQVSLYEKESLAPISLSWLLLLFLLPPWMRGKQFLLLFVNYFVHRPQKGNVSFLSFFPWVKETLCSRGESFLPVHFKIILYAFL